MWVDASAWLADGGAEVAEADAAADAALAVDDPADAATEAAATPPPAPPKPPPKMPGPKAPAFAGDASVPSGPGGHDTVAALVRSAAGGFAFDNAEAASQYLITQHSIVTVPWDDAGAFLRFSVTYEAANEQAEDDLMAEAESRLKQAELKF